MAKTLDIISKVLCGAIFASAPVQAELLAEKDAGLPRKTIGRIKRRYDPHYLRLSTTSYAIRLMRLFSKA